MEHAVHLGKPACVDRLGTIPF